MGRGGGDGGGQAGVRQVAVHVKERRVVLAVADIGKKQSNHAPDNSVLPVVLVVAGSGQSDHHGAVEGQHHRTQTPTAPPALVREALQLPRQVKRSEPQARKGK